MRRPDLKVLTKAVALRLVFEGDRAVGIEFLRSCKRKVAYAMRGVILSAGTIKTPQLLMLPGIGNPDKLARSGISVRSRLDGVGANLQDHVQAGFEYQRRPPGLFQCAL